MKKACTLLVALLMLVSLVACGGGDAPAPAPAQNTGEGGGSTASEGEYEAKIALCLPGPANDGAWSTIAYEAVMAAKEVYNIEVLYTESVQPTDMEAVFTDYASSGCDLIIGHSFGFGDAALTVGERYPDVAFAIIDGTAASDNVASYNLSTQEQGYIGGVLAASMSESGKVGIIAGVEGPSIIKVAEAFKLGAKSVNPDIVAMSAYTGSFDDAAKSKEAAQAMIDQGADFFHGCANQSNAGMIKACEENGILCIGEMEQQSLAPNNVVMCTQSDVAGLVQAAVREVMDGEFTGGIHEFGFAEGVLSFTDYGALEDEIPQETKDLIDQTIEDMKSGALVVPKVEQITPD